MKIYSPLSLLTLAACSAAGSAELFDPVNVPRSLDPAATAAGAAAAQARSSEGNVAATDPESAKESTPDSPTPANGAGNPFDVASSADEAPPSVAQTYPADGEAGVIAETEIVLEFSEAMDRSATFVALSADGQPITVEQDWHDQDRRLRLTPEVPLAYADGDSETPALTYVVSILDGARDVAGNGLPAHAFSFQTLRRVTEVLVPVIDTEYTGTWRGDGALVVEDCTSGAICVGDDAFAADPETSAQYRGFLSFDLRELPEQLIEVVDARIHLKARAVEGDPFSALGQLRLERAVFDAVGAPAFDAAPQATFAAMIDPDLGATGEHILWAVEADLGANGLHQYRLNFDRGSNRDAARDVVLFATDEQQLELTYLLP